MTRPESLAAAVRPETKLIWVETPSNPLLKLVDLEAVAGFARKRGILCARDNTFATPWVQRPLELGFDVVMHSATKYLPGHSSSKERRVGTESVSEVRSRWPRSH